MLLDVDGVLNAISSRGDGSAWRDWKTGSADTPSGTWPILYSPTVVAAIREWHERALAEIRWLADWGDLANGDLRALLSLPEFPVVPAAATPPPDRPWRQTDQRAPWWKFDAVKALIAEEPGRPLLWVDDDLRFDRAVAKWMQENTTSLLVTPHTHLGLTPKHLRVMEQWLQEHGDQVPA